MEVKGYESRVSTTFIDLNSVPILLIDRNSSRSSNFGDALLVTIQRNLFALKNFLDRNPQLLTSAPGEQVSSGGRQSEQDAWKAEATSISHLQALLERTIEAISFVLLLIDYHFGDLILQCDKDTQTMITNITYEELITTTNGLHVSRMLVNVIINQQIGQQISVSSFVSFREILLILLSD